MDQHPTQGVIVKCNSDGTIDEVEARKLEQEHGVLIDRTANVLQQKRIFIVPPFEARS